MQNENKLDQIHKRFASGELSDVGFDAFLPPSARARSPYTWTPIAVARRAALHFAERGAKRVLDVGCGPGKFCVVAGLAHPELSFCGVEHNPRLACTAKGLTAGLHLSNVEIRNGDALDAPWHDFDGFYFFNPFSGGSRLGGDKLLRVAELLRAAPRKAIVVTYHGLGGPIPPSYDLIVEERVGSGPLRVWQKNRSREGAWYHLDYSDDVSRVPRQYLERKLAALSSSDQVASE